MPSPTGALLVRARALIGRRRFAAGVLGAVALVGLMGASTLASAASTPVATADSTSVGSSSRPATWEALRANGAGGTATAPVDPVAQPRKARKPVPASATRKARNVPFYPRDDNHGKRAVYDKALMTVWLVNEDDEVVARYPVVGRFDRPLADVYRVYSKSPASGNPFSKVTFRHMVRFAWGLDTTSSIGLHDIPRYYDGSMMHSEEQLGLAIARGGCVRMAPEAAEHVYRFLDVGDRVVVLPSP